MGRHKGSQNAQPPLKRRDLSLYKKTVKEIRYVGVQNLADKAGISKTQVYNLINGCEGVSDQTEEKIYDSLEILIPLRRAQIEQKKQKAQAALAV